MPDPTPPLDLAAIDVQLDALPFLTDNETEWSNAAADLIAQVPALVARVRALEAEVARLQAPALTVTADTDCTILSLRARLPDGTEVDLPVG